MFKKEILDYINLEISVIKKMDIDAINAAMVLLNNVYDNQGNIYIFGNGGSSATASHFQNDFNKGISEYVDKKFNFICLNDNVPTVMAIANDIGFSEVFRFQLLNKVTEKDVVIAISGSGNSENVLNAVRYAKEQGCKVIGLTGFDGGKLANISDVSINVPVQSMQVTEDLHMMLDHLMMAIFYKVIAGKNHVVVK